MGEGPKKRPESAVNAPLGPDLRIFDVGVESCGTCRKSLTKPGQKFCSSRCRLLHWAAKEILKAYRTGRAEGLKEIVAEIAGIHR